MTNFNESKLSKVLARRVIAPEDRSQLLPLSTPIYCPTHNGVRAARVTIINPQSNSFYTDNSIADTVMIGSQYKKVAGTPAHLEAVTNPSSVKNTVDIDLNKTLNLKYFVPHEVDLETDVDLMDIIKSDFAVKFKHSVSSNITGQIAELKAANKVTTITQGETLAETLGEILADYIHNGTGQKFSIYKYDNGAPIEYISNSAQPEIDDIIKKDDILNSYASTNQRNIPGLYYYEGPSLVLPEATLKQYQTGLVAGTIKDYVNKKLNVDSADIEFSTIGAGIFGSNDCFAVAFTEPSIKIADSTDFYGKEICITVNYGVLLVNQTNLRVIV